MAAPAAGGAEAEPARRCEGPMAEGGPPGGGDAPAASSGQAGNVAGGAAGAAAGTGAPFGLALCREGTGQPPPPPGRAQPGSPALSPAQVVT